MSTKNVWTSIQGSRLTSGLELQRLYDTVQQHPAREFVSIQKLAPKYYVMPTRPATHEKVAAARIDMLKKLLSALDEIEERFV